MKIIDTERKDYNGLRRPHIQNRTNKGAGKE